MTLFRTDLRETGVASVVGLTGDLDAASVYRLLSVLQRLPPAADVVLDLAGATLIDAAAVAELMAAVRDRQARGGRLRAVGATGHVLQVLEITGVAKELGAHLDVATALEDLAEDQCALDGTGAVPTEPGATERGPAEPGSVESGSVESGSVESGSVESGSVESGSVESGLAALAETVHGLLCAAAALPPGTRRRELRDRAVAAALPYARRLAARYRHRGEPTEDLHQVAALGLVKAVNGYQPERGSGFLRYAAPTILGELRRHFRDAGWTLRVPRWVQELRLEVNRATDTLAQALGRQPSSAELADYLEIPEAEVRLCQSATRNYRPVSLSAPAGPDEAGALADAVGDDDPRLDLVEYRQSVAPLLAGLTDHEREVISLRFFGEMTQSQIAARVGTSQMHVSRLLAAVLGRLRCALAEA